MTLEEICVLLAQTYPSCRGPVPTWSNPGKHHGGPESGATFDVSREMYDLEYIRPKHFLQETVSNHQALHNQPPACLPTSLSSPDLSIPIATMQFSSTIMAGLLAALASAAPAASSSGSSLISRVPDNTHLFLCKQHGWTDCELWDVKIGQCCKLDAFPMAHVSL